MMNKTSRIGAFGLVGVVGIFYLIFLVPLVLPFLPSFQLTPIILTQAFLVLLCPALLIWSTFSLLYKHHIQARIACILLSVYGLCMLGLMLYINNISDH
jgi:hypothetical protein